MRIKCTSCDAQLNGEFGYEVEGRNEYFCDEECINSYYDATEWYDLRQTSEVYSLEFEDEFEDEEDEDKLIRLKDELKYCSESEKDNLLNQISELNKSIR